MARSVVRLIRLVRLVRLVRVLELRSVKLLSLLLLLLLVTPSRIQIVSVPLDDPVRRGSVTPTMQPGRGAAVDTTGGVAAAVPSTTC